MTAKDDIFKPVSLPSAKKVFPDLFANKIVGVQPINTPAGQSFAARFGGLNSLSEE